MSRKLIRRSATGQLTSAGMPRLLQRIYQQRGVDSVAEVSFELKNLLTPASLMGIKEAAELLSEAITQQKNIVIVGDYDADGATSTALMVLVIRSMGGRVDYVIPNRFEYGYGLTPEIVSLAAEKNPWLLVTVDNGIASHDGVTAAKELGIRVLITDHHLPGDELPLADAIVNPNQPGCSFPSKNLAGVGVAFYVLSSLRQRLRAVSWFEGRDEPRLADFLDLVALGTVADVVPLDTNNRILVEEGLKRIRLGRCRPGLQALIRRCRVHPQRLTAMDLGFHIAPKLNAAGRISEMSKGVDCLLAIESTEADEWAEALTELNSSRRDIEKGMRDQAEQILGAQNFDKAPPVAGLCLYHPDWHHGVVGIVASRVKESINRPVIVFAKDDAGMLRGSARSIEGIHIRDVLADIDVKNAGLIAKFGGHAMAAGLTLAKDHYDVFTKAFEEETARWMTPAMLDHAIVSDGAVGEDVSVQSVTFLLTAAPWGQGFPSPIFDDEFELLEQRIVGEYHLRLRVRLIETGQIFTAMAFNQNELLEETRVHLAYRLDVNDYRGMESVQLIVDSLSLTV